MVLWVEGRMDMLYDWEGWGRGVLHIMISPSKMVVPRCMLAFN